MRGHIDPSLKQANQSQAAIKHCEIIVFDLDHLLKPQPLKKQAIPRAQGFGLREAEGFQEVNQLGIGTS